MISEEMLKRAAAEADQANQVLFLLVHVKLKSTIVIHLLSGWKEQTVQ